MTDKKTDPTRESDTERGAKEPDDSSGGGGDGGGLGAGQEATVNAPTNRSHEHDSNYGGGGTNGGASKS